MITIYRLWIWVWTSAKTSVTHKTTIKLMSVKHFAMLRMHPKTQNWMIPSHHLLPIHAVTLTLIFTRINTARNGTRMRARLSRIELRMMWRRISVGRKATTTIDGCATGALWDTARSLPTIAARHTSPTPTSGTSVLSMTRRMDFIYISNQPWHSSQRLLEPHLLSLHLSFEKDEK